MQIKMKCKYTLGTLAPLSAEVEPSDSPADSALLLRRRGDETTFNRNKLFSQRSASSSEHVHYLRHLPQERCFSTGNPGRGLARLSLTHLFCLSVLLPLENGDYVCI